MRKALSFRKLCTTRYTAKITNWRPICQYCVFKAKCSYLNYFEPAQYGRLFTVAESSARPRGLLLSASCKCPSLEMISLPCIGISSVLEKILWIS